MLGTPPADQTRGTKEAKLKGPGIPAAIWKVLGVNNQTTVCHQRNGRLNWAHRKIKDWLCL
jgi:hypothetical protein